MRKIITASILFLCFYHTLPAQELSVDLSEVEISASSGKLYSELGRILTVVEKSEINSLPIQTIDEMLDYVAGIDVRQRGTGGVQSDISIRGGSFDQILILLNGVNITNPQSGHYNLDIPVDLSDVDRIEILQGSSARVLGANAFSGAINIITSQTKKKQLSSQISAGSYKTIAPVVSASYYKGNFNSFITASHQQSDGYIDNTDYKISNAFIHLNMQNSKAGKLGLQGGAQHKLYGANGFYSLTYPHQQDETRTFFTALTWSLHRNKWIYNAQAYWRQHHDWFQLFRNFENAPDWYTNHNYHQTDVTGGKATVSYLSSFGKLTAGADIRNEHIYSNVLGKAMTNPRPVPFGEKADFTHKDNRLLTNVFLDYSHKWRSWYLSFGGAANIVTGFDTHFFGGVDLGYDINDNITAFASYNSAVRIPTFTDLYYKSATQLANPDLQPEKSQTIEGGVKCNTRKWSAEACLYYRMGSNVIDWVRIPDSIRWESRNLTDVNALGGDITLQYRFDNIFIRNVHLIYSYVHLNKDAQDFDSKYALDYMKHKFILSCNHTIWGKLSATWKASLIDRAGNYSEFETNKLIEYKPYFMLDGKLMWSENRFDIYADIRNISDTKYEDYGGLPQPGINCNFGIKMRIN